MSKRIDDLERRIERLELIQTAALWLAIGASWAMVLWLALQAW